MRSLLVPLAIVVAAACGSSGPRWLGDGIHEVDGYWVGLEEACDIRAVTGCNADIGAAMTTIGVREAPDVVGARVARVPRAYVDAEGRTIVATTSGLVEPSVVVLELADGRRRAVTLMCDVQVHDDTGSVASYRRCWPSDLSYLRTDRPPSTPDGA